MADDLDDLLDEVESSFESDFINVEDKRSIKTDDLNELLDDFEPPLQPHDESSDTPTHSSSAKRRCANVSIGGTSMPIGLATSATQRSCSTLRCLQCDSPVVSFDGFTWTDETDYLFLRNNYPDMDRLLSHLDSSRGSRAYACQCKFRSVSNELDLDDDKDLQWICGKH
ncbi:hypothetical protein SK128_019012 [Halocaridina rubra]|uniref:Cilia- and flagella-associated protein 418 n=1 Tax=Halocaridina rubra TaxID=373956 RepID=A0AAN8WJQ3_HALRR